MDGEVTHSQQSNNPVDPAGVPNEVTIGTWTTEAWPGIVDEVRLWNRVLTEKEIQESMEKGKDSFTAVQPGGKITTSWGSLKAGL